LCTFLTTRSKHIPFPFNHFRTLLRKHRDATTSTHSKSIPTLSLSLFCTRARRIPFHFNHFRTLCVFTWGGSKNVFQKSAATLFLHFFALCCKRAKRIPLYFNHFPALCKNTGMSVKAFFRYRHSSLASLATHHFLSASPLEATLTKKQGGCRCGRAVATPPLVNDHSAGTPRVRAQVRMADTSRSVMNQHSKKDRRQPGAGGFVVKPGGHQGHGLDDAQAIREAPTEQSVVSRRHKNSGAAEGFR